MTRTAGDPKAMATELARLWDELEARGAVVYRSELNLADHATLAARLEEARRRLRALMEER